MKRAPGPFLQSSWSRLMPACSYAASSTTPALARAFSASTGRMISAPDLCVQTVTCKSTQGTRAMSAVHQSWLPG
jgi:hypothetical protein